MTKWVILLRAIGIVLLFALAGDFMLSARSGFGSDSRFLYANLVIALERLALVVLCFGAAAALRGLERMNAYIERAASRRRVMPKQKDFAPVAPNWSTPLDPPRVEVTPGFKPQRRIDRKDRS